MKSNRIILVLAIIFYCVLLESCKNREKIVDKSKLLGYDYRLFQQTPAWELAKAVEDEDENKINKILKENPKLIDYQEERFGNTLLVMTIVNQKIKPFKILLENGADVNLKSDFDGSSALIESCKYDRDAEFVRLLIDYGADVNQIFVHKDEEDKNETPLMLASNYGSLEVVKLLVEYGANMNFKNKYGQSALSEAAIRNKYEVVLYLLKKGADYKQPIFYRLNYSAPPEKFNPNDKTNPIYLLDELRFYMPELDTKEYYLKMQIVEFLRNKGIEYKDVPIPEYVIKKSKERYPETWQEYLDKY